MVASWHLAAPIASRPPQGHQSQWPKFALRAAIAASESRSCSNLGRAESWGRLMLARVSLMIMVENGWRWSGKGWFQGKKDESSGWYWLITYNGSDSDNGWTKKTWCKFQWLIVLGNSVTKCDGEFRKSMMFSANSTNTLQNRIDHQCNQRIVLATKKTVWCFQPLSLAHGNWLSSTMNQDKPLLTMTKTYSDNKTAVY